LESKRFLVFVLTSSFPTPTLFCVMLMARWKVLVVTTSSLMSFSPSLIVRRSLQFNKLKKMQEKEEEEEEEERKKELCI
jgi:hypothetical protein